MNEILKQRLVGALILVALGVVFWPIIFVQPDTGGSGQLHMPPRPEVDTSPVAPPDRAGLRTSPRLDAAEDEIANVGVDTPDANAPVLEPVRVTAQTQTPSAAVKSEAPEPARPATRSEAPAPQKLDAQGVPIAWILQVASVSSQDKADQLRDRLLGMGHKAYVKQVRINDRLLQRVYIGPKFERARLESLKAEIDSEFGVKSMIKRYLP